MFIPEETEEGQKLIEAYENDRHALFVEVDALQERQRKAWTEQSRALIQKEIDALIAPIEARRQALHIRFNEMHENQASGVNQ